MGKVKADGFSLCCHLKEPSDFHVTGTTKSHKWQRVAQWLAVRMRSRVQCARQQDDPMSANSHLWDIGNNIFALL